MKRIKQLNIKAWSVWGQVLLVFTLASILFGTISGRLVKNMETSYLYEKQRLFTQQTFQTIISGSIEALIIEDRPVLNTTVKELIAADTDIHYVSIHNEEGDILVEWKSDESIDPQKLLALSENVVYEGEVFGYIEIVWDTRPLQKDLESHVFSVQVFVVLTIFLLALVILVWLFIVVIKPMSRLIHRLDPDNFKKLDHISESVLLPVEFRRLHSMIDKLKEVSISREELSKEVKIRQQAEQAAELARDEAVRANDVKSIFLANISHELRTPLNAIIGYSDLLIVDAKDKGDDKSREALSTIKMSGKYLLEIINSILDFSKIEANKMQLHLEDVDIKTLVDEIRMISLPMMEKNKNRLQIVIARDVDTLCTDSTRLHQILLNLLSNAAKFTREGVVTIEVHSDQNNVKFIITDTGIGIAENDIDKLFTPFMQGDNSMTREYQGTGLGLAITMRLVELLGGTITFSSEKNLGATFVVILPNKTHSAVKLRKSNFTVCCSSMSCYNTRYLNSLNVKYNGKKSWQAFCKYTIK